MSTWPLLSHVWVLIKDNSIFISHYEKEGYTKVKLETPLMEYMGWSVEDFEQRAADIEEFLESKEPVYDRSKFKLALTEMVRSHDAQIGLTWDTVDFWLDEICRLEKK